MSTQAEESNDSKTNSKENIAKSDNNHIMTDLKDFELLKQGAEAKIYKGKFEGKSSIVKERFKKTYRHPDLDKSLTKKRIKNEVKILNKAQSLGVSVPKVYKTDLNNGLIIMEFIENSLICRDYIFNLVGLKNKNEITQDEFAEKIKQDSLEIGKIIGNLHRNEVIHGDLTTSNILIKNAQVDTDSSATNTNQCSSRIVFIDFGLSVISSQLEDKAVDLYSMC
jgi:TP53 regulating kinase and related kinases